MNLDKIKGLLRGKLIRGGIWLTLCTIIQQIISYTSMGIFTRLLGTEGFGTVKYYAIMLTIATTVITLGLTASVNRAKVEYEKDFDKFLSSIMFLAMLLSVIALTVVILFNKQLNSIKALEISGGVLILLVIHSFFTFTFQCYALKYIIKQNYKRYFLVQVSNALTALILSVVFVILLNNNAIGRIYGMALTTIAFGSYFFLKQIKCGKEFINKAYWKYALVISVPLIFHSLSSMIMTYFDSVAIKQFLSESELGLYGVAYSVGLIINTVWVTLNKLWVPWFFDKMKKENYEEIEKAIKYYMLIFTFIYFAFMMVVPEVVRLLADKEFWVALDIIPIIALSYYFLFLYSFPSNVEFYEKKTVLISLGTLISGAVNIILNLLLIPRYGYRVAAVTTLISYILLFIYHYMMAKIVSDVTFIKLKHYIIAILTSSVITLSFYVLVNRVFLRYVIFIGLLVFIWKKFKNFMNVLKAA
ncbi:oligosaccharide flippase family protein [Oceanirhabdus sp. W0125-5]|uniref:oligosaccharide flippase family protein n=1 Tax=Oceanirhabdus sp. W0125-5 TaxID=2999116 RepID=UPI0022F2B0B0|nr:oligosaccharide flippase family protein [Oceanirhabdus sp. W0125-5]WBW99442.1 oligosaccharide flippase family protein [Oceanirhabdus sp. W0125-5]